MEPETAYELCASFPAVGSQWQRKQQAVDKAKSHETAGAIIQQPLPGDAT